MTILRCSTLALVFFFPLAVTASGKKKPEPPATVGKKVVALADVKSIQIEMPNQAVHNFGRDYQGSLTNQLMRSERYLVSNVLEDSQSPKRSALGESPSEYWWVGSVTPTATLRVYVEALNFRTGSRGEQTFYGFDEKFRTPFNDGTATLANEFPLKSVSYQPSWFGNSFDKKGIEPFDSRSGLDLGDGFDLNVLFAWLSVKYATYHSELHLKLALDTPMGAATEYRWIEVKGDGFFFDISGAYEGYSAGISVARGDAMEQALKRALDGSFNGIDRALSELPLMAKIDHRLADGTILMGTGPFSEIKSGVLYEIVEYPETIIQVSSSNASGSIGKVISGSVTHANAGMLLRQVASLPKPNDRSAVSGPLASAQKLTGPEMLAGVPGVVDSTQLSNINFPEVKLDGLAPFVSRLQAYWKSIKGAVFLPYRIGRYFLYDQPYRKKADLGRSELFDMSREAWAQQIGLNTAPEMANVSPLVAVIDSGVDYNHPVLHDSIWFNPSPDSDEHHDPHGWDFVSEDPRPYDDGYHGTQVASVVVHVAPRVKILPIKIFNPWGITSSAAVYAAFAYAVDHGAQIILCGWSTRSPSQALEMGIAYARDHGVVVVTAAGDQGSNLHYASIYPTVYARRFDNIVAVTGVDVNDQLVKVSEKSANYDPTTIHLAAPGQGIRVAEPRLGRTRASSTGLAAAIVAGAMARNLAAENLSGNYHDWINRLAEDAEPVAGLKSAVKGGLRLYIRR